MKCVLLLLTFFGLLDGISRLQAQDIRVIQSGDVADSSYYDIARVDANEFWVGGENGILKCLDTLGNISNVPLPVPDRHILKIVPWGKYVYIAADQGTIFRYDRIRDRWVHADFSDQGFEKLTFYDMVVTNEGTVVVAGGHHKIAKGKLAIPRGFIARMDEDLLTKPEIVWSHGLMFPFALEYNEADDEVMAVAFTGVNSQLFTSIDGVNTFQRKGSLPGLVHHIALFDGELWYSGAKNLRYTKTGIIGKMGEKPMEMEGEGCIWSLLKIGDQVYSLAFNGAIVGGSDQLTDYVFKVRPAQTSLYEAVGISDQKAFVVGHGRTILMLTHLSNQEGVNLRVRR